MEKNKVGKTALLVLDAQQIYTERSSELYCQDNDKTIANINHLIDLFSRNDLPVIFVRHVHARDGSDLGRMFDYAGNFEDFNFKEGLAEVELDPSLRKVDGVVEIIKHRYSAFQGTDLDELLHTLGVTRVVVCGFMTNFCCESTAREAHDRDFFVTFVPDATGCPDLEDLDQDEIRAVVTKLLAAGFATIRKTNEVADDLRG